MSMYKKETLNDIFNTNVVSEIYWIIKNRCSKKEMCQIHMPCEESKILAVRMFGTLVMAVGV